MKYSFILSLLATLLLFININLYSQMLFNNEKTNETISFAERQYNFNNWLKGKNVSKNKGWKHYPRWEWLNQGRFISEGTFANDDYYIEAQTKIKTMNEKNPAILSSLSWSPLGPLEFPTSPEKESGHGMGRINCVTFHPTDPNTMWIGAPHGGVWKTNNDGESWTPIGDDLPLMRVSDIAVDPSNPDVLYLAMGDYAYVSMDVTNRVRFNGFGLGIYKTTNGGETWFQTSLARMPENKELSLFMGVLVNSVETNKIIAAGSTGIFISNDGGNSWEQTNNEIIWDIKQDPTNANTVYMTTGYLPSVNNQSYARIYKSTDFGQTWNKLNSGIPEQYTVPRIELAVSSSNPNFIYAITCDLNSGFHSFYKSEDAGATWSKQSDFLSAPNMLGWSLGDGDDQGGQGTYDLTLLVNPKNSNEVYVGGVNEWGTSDAGVTWNLISFWQFYFGYSLHADQHCAKYNSLNGNYYFTHDGGICKTKEVLIGNNSKIKEVWEDTTGMKEYEFPTKITDLSAGLGITEFYKFGICKNYEKYLIGGAQDNGSYYYNNSYWLNCIGGDGMEAMIDHNNPEIVYGTVYYGSLFKSIDGMKTSYKNGYCLTDTIIKFANESGCWVTPFIMHPQNPETIYAGFGNLWKTTNGGDNWIKLSDFPINEQLYYPLPIFSMGLSENHPENIVIYKRLYPAYSEVGQLWKTIDEGQTWTDISKGLPLDSLYVNAISVHSDNPNIIMCAMSGFVDGKKIYLTTDGGANWYNYSGNLPNVPVNAVIHQKNSSTFYIGTDIGVFYTNDENPGWNAYNTNFPNIIVTDLEINYNSSKIFASTFGRGIWENELIKPTSVMEENSLAGKILISPNPSKGKLNITFKEQFNSAYVEIVNIVGMIVYKNEFSNFAQGQIALDLNLPDGVYFVKIFSKSEGKQVKNYVEKIIIRK